MSLTRTKICGITNIPDAQAAVNAGADAIGLVFYSSSPRYVTIAKAIEITRVLPPFITTVGLFVNANRTEVDRVLDEVSIDMIQFHGDESVTQCELFNRPYIKAIRMKDGVDLYRLQEYYATARGLLLDTYKKGIPGGTGESFNWDIIPHDLSKPVILAGGLDSDNIARAVKQVKPYAVDVSGGVEVAKGVKDHQQIVKFIQAVKQSNN